MLCVKFLIVMLNVIVLNVVMLSVIVLTVIMLSIVMLSVMASLASLKNIRLDQSLAKTAYYDSMSLKHSSFLLNFITN